MTFVTWHCSDCVAALLHCVAFACFNIRRLRLSPHVRITRTSQRCWHATRTRAHALPRLRTNACAPRTTPAARGVAALAHMAALFGIIHSRADADRQCRLLCARWWVACTLLLWTTPVLQPCTRLPLWRTCCNSHHLPTPPYRNVGRDQAYAYDRRTAPQHAVDAPYLRDNRLQRWRG